MNSRNKNKGSPHHRRKQRSKIRAELNDIETRSTILRISVFRSWFFEKINKINKPLRKLIKKKRETMKISIIINESGEITNHTIEIQRTVGNY